MQQREHVFAVVEQNQAAEVSLDVITDHVARGGKATVVVLVTQQARDELRWFADTERIGEARAFDRLAETYTSRVGGRDTEAIIADSASSARDLLDIASETCATSIVIPQQLAARRSLRKLVSGAHVPVLVTPAA
jgi:hypothetical protein